MTPFSKKLNQLFLCTVIVISTNFVFGQEPIDVAELTVKLKGNSEEKLYYGFAEGDQIIFNFTEEDGKELKELEISEYGVSSKFSDYKTKKVENKKFTVSKKGIFEFRFKNDQIFAGRVCKIKIQRIAKEETKNFNTGIRWVEQYDTTYNYKTKDVIVGYANREVQRSKRVLARVDTAIVTVLDRTERVHSMMNPSQSNTSYIDFSLPQNVAEPNVFLPERTKEVIGWSYFVATSEQAQQNLQQANFNVDKAVKLGSKVLGFASANPYGALAVLALEGVSYFAPPPSGENVIYNVYGWSNSQQYVLDSGDGVMSTKRIDRARQGDFRISLTNDNKVQSINVNVKVIAVTIEKIYRDKAYTETVSEPIKEKKTFKQPIIKSKKAAIHAE